MRKTRGQGIWVDTTCNICSVPIHAREFRKKRFCSRICAFKGHAIQMKGRVASNKGIPMSKEQKLKISKTKTGVRPSPEAIAKQIGLHVGSKNGKWIEDRSLLKTGREKAYDTKYKYWMRAVKNRDGWKCKISNGDCSGLLEAHHILGWRDHSELRYTLTNGITLCHYHHPRKREEENRLSPYFQSLVEKAN